MEKARPIPGVDYPRTFQEMDDWFQTEGGCRDYVRRLRWPAVFVCRRCGAVEEPWVTARGVLRCTACNAETSLTAGTVCQDTCKPLRMWLLAMWFITSQKNGVSALGLQRVLGLGSDETAWTWLHTLRRAMVRPERERLTGDIEIDETAVGGPEEGTRGRETETKALVVVATEKRGHAIGRIRVRRIQDVSAKSLRQFIRETIEPGATIQTDGWRGDAGLADAGDPHRITVISAGLEQAHEVMPRVPTVAARLTRWLLGTLHGGTQYQHLDDSLDAFTFRFHRRRAPARGLLFHRLAQQAVAVWPAPCHVIISGPRPLLG